MRQLLLASVIGIGVGCTSISPRVPDERPPVYELTVGGAIGGEVTGAPSKTPGVNPEDLIQPGDSLEVTVRRGSGEEKYTPIVRANGLITVAFTDIDVKGLSEAEAEARITDQLRAIIRNPSVQVRLAKKEVTRPRNYYVLGEVKMPGKLPLERRMTLLQGLAQGGGHTDIADLEKVVIISQRGETPLIRVANLQTVLVTGDLTADLALQENDVVFVPRSKIGDWNVYYTRAVLPVLNTTALAVNTVFIGKALEVLFRTPLPTTGVAVAAPCWVASVLYGEHAWQTHLLRWYISGPLSKQTVGRLFLDLYIRYGQQVARFLKRYPSAQVVIKPLFDRLLQRALVAVDDTRPVSQTRMQRSIRLFPQTG